MEIIVLRKIKNEIIIRFCYFSRMSGNITANNEKILCSCGLEILKNDFEEHVSSKKHKMKKKHILQKETTDRLQKQENEALEKLQELKLSKDALEQIVKEKDELLLKQERERIELQEASKKRMESSQGERKLFLEESRTKDRLGDCFADLTKTPSNIVQEHRKLVSSSDNYDNSSKRYMHEEKVYELCCKRELVFFSHKCKITVYEIL